MVDPYSRFEVTAPSLRSSLIDVVFLMLSSGDRALTPSIYPVVRKPCRSKPYIIK